MCFSILDLQRIDLIYPEASVTEQWVAEQLAGTSYCPWIYRAAERSSNSVLDSRYKQATFVTRKSCIFELENLLNFYESSGTYADKPARVFKQGGTLNFILTWNFILTSNFIAMCISVYVHNRLDKSEFCPKQYSFVVKTYLIMLCWLFGPREWSKICKQKLHS